jgi:hypothetical protein
MAYAGSWEHHLPLVMKLHAEGKSADEVAALRLTNCYGDPLTAALVTYIIGRERGIKTTGLSKRYIEAIRRDNEHFVEDFMRRSEKWKNERTLPPYLFETAAAQICAYLEQIELAARRYASDSQ